jgi:glycosyltransferase involved in cell wall biosynthesis
MLATSAPSTPFSPAVVAPTFNNSATLADVLERTARLGFPIIVVNDGSTDQTEVLLKTLPSVQVRSHWVNRGKAAAIRTGAEAAAHLGFTHIVTIDTDGQHDPEDIPILLEQARQSPDSLILGRRARRMSGYPMLNRAGRWISNGLVWLECGLRLDDTQCGLRVYPLNLIAEAPSAASRYGFETEILTLAAWRGCPIIQIDVKCRYDVADGRISHFQPWRDSLRAGRMHAGLLAAAVPRWPLRFHPAAIWRDWRGTPKRRKEFAGGLALGVFCACLPLYGIQGILSLVGARMLRFNRLSALAGSQLSSPPIGAGLIAISIAIGHLLLNGHWLGAGAWQMAHASSRPWSMLRTFLLDWALGSLVLGAVLSAITYIAARGALRMGRPAAILSAAGVSGAGQELIQTDRAKPTIL